ncbi:uncharacterized protein LOC126904822 isoform X5 [Daktulosphaira vitifoliae]|uniref:uncharacterized protein LOC126904822 isoform X4 n=1 Tax=Daktulosphaira vitifoliae TaxID=58002 RepID=UPI0021AA269E|nr:uncharacterized protein LOC126904822 isoform X4 [Daktulosphaira vitifoliae]XP_050540057.1 uncharacterized protein LOC126904822 isoform X5 [Daktulosphaira vitifoliae]
MSKIYKKSVIKRLNILETRNKKYTRIPPEIMKQNRLKAINKILNRGNNLTNINMSKRQNNYIVGLNASLLENMTGQNEPSDLKRKNYETSEIKIIKRRKMCHSPIRHDQMVDNIETVIHNGHHYNVQQVYDANTNPFLQRIKREICMASGTVIIQIP